MEDDFNPDELRPVPWEPDTELTLGWGTLIGIALCLVVLCGLCFWQGYSMGHRSLRDSTPAGQQPGSKTATPSAPKPSASPQGGYKPRASIDNQPLPDQSGAAPAYGSAPLLGGGTVQAAVKPALPDKSPAPILMVQVAAVSHKEDADVLVGALRKRGYAVTSHRDPADNMIHVQVGPFVSRNDANAMRMKLLNDGYNANVQP